MERQTDSHRFSFPFALVMNKLGTHSPQLQATSTKVYKILSLPALQKTCVDFFFEFAWGLALKDGGDFSDSMNFQWSPFPRKQNTKVRKQFGKIRSKLNSGNFRSATFLRLPEIFFAFAFGQAPRHVAFEPIFLRFYVVFGRFQLFSVKASHKSTRNRPLCKYQSLRLLIFFGTGARRQHPSFGNLIRFSKSTALWNLWLLRTRFSSVENSMWDRGPDKKP